jgi:nitrite reductase/ring-hydroxylating ferredoxin subunit
MDALPHLIASCPQPDEDDLFDDFSAFCTVDELLRSWRDGQGLVRTVGVTRVTVLVSSTGQMHAMQATCPHAGGPLNEGELVPEKGRATGISCPWHHMTFSLETGQLESDVCDIEDMPSSDTCGNISLFNVCVHDDEVHVSTKCKIRR